MYGVRGRVGVAAPQPVVMEAKRDQEGSVDMKKMVVQHAQDLLWKVKFVIQELVHQVKKL